MVILSHIAISLFLWSHLEQAVALAGKPALEVTSLFDTILGGISPGASEQLRAVCAYRDKRAPCGALIWFLLPASYSWWFIPTGCNGRYYSFIITCVIFTEIVVCHINEILILTIWQYLRTACRNTANPSRTGCCSGRSASPGGCRSE